VRLSHVPGPLAITARDVQDAGRLLESAVPLVADIVGADPHIELRVATLLRSDAKYLEPHLLDPKRKRMSQTIDGLAKGAFTSRTSLYPHMGEVATWLEEFSIAFAILLAARGDYFDRTLWRLCEVDSPVGRGAQVPGMIGHVQRLIGIALSGGDMDLPVLLAAPGEDLDDAALAYQLGGMALRVAEVADKVRRYRTRADGAKLREFGLDPDALREFEPSRTLLGTALRAGPETRGGWLAPLYPGSPEMAQLARDAGFVHTVLETADGPPRSGEGWTRLSQTLLNQIGARAAIFGLDVAVRGTQAAIYRRDDGRAVSRRQLADASGSERALAREMTFDVQGLDFIKPNELAQAVVFAEFLATSPHAKRCNERFGRDLTPAYVKAPKPESRALFRALRTMRNHALVTVARRRQADEDTAA
jgi:hypothetical protein